MGGEEGAHLLVLEEGALVDKTVPGHTPYIEPRTRMGTNMTTSPLKGCLGRRVVYLLVLEEGALVDKTVPVFELEAQLPRRVCL